MPKKFRIRFVQKDLDKNTWKYFIKQIKLCTVKNVNNLNRLKYTSGKLKINRFVHYEKINTYSY